jgi:tyrosyl-tRNA synthetase
MEGGQAHVYSTPLVINKATGVKFGKSEGGAIWLNPKKTSVYKFYQFWLNVDDEGVIDYAKIYTLLSKEELEQLSQDHHVNPGARLAQKTLAREVTALVHGKERTESVIRVTDVLFGKQEFNTLDENDIELLSNEIPTVGVNKTLIDVLVESATASSNGEARRLIVSGAITVNGIRITDDMHLQEAALIKKGKNTFVLVHP